MIPLPYVIGWKQYLSGATDAHHNPTDSWDEEIPLPAAWYVAGTSEPLMAGHERVIVDVVAYVSSEHHPHPRDRYVVDGDEYELIGQPSDHTHGPWWNPHRIALNLKRVADV